MASTYYNPNRSGSFDIQGQPVPDFIKDFLEHEKAVYHLSPFSLRNYCLTVGMLIRWLICRNKDAYDETVNISEVGKEILTGLKSADISAFLDYCRDVRGNGTASISNKLSCLNTFFDYCVKDADLLTENPAAGINAPKKISREAKCMTAREALQLIDACNCGEMPARDVCIATFMLNCGLRISEVVAVNLPDIDGNKLKIWGNGRNDRIVCLNDDCMEALSFLKTERNMYSLDSSALFVSKRHNSRITERAVEQMLDKAFERAGLKERGYTARSLRMTATSLMYSSGNFDVPDLQLILGHKSTAFAKRYTTVNGEKARKAMSEFKIK